MRRKREGRRVLSTEGAPPAEPLLLMRDLRDGSWETTRQKCHSHGRVMSADRTVLDSYRAAESNEIDDAWAGH